MAFSYGLEVLMQDKKRLANLKKKRVALICHPASVDQKLNHSIDVLRKKLNIVAAFGPQHGIKGDKQDNMIESETFIDPKLKIPVYSLYGEVRAPTDEMMQSADVFIYDLQDLGCRIYTFITTMLYVMQACARLNKEFIVLDRPNPCGRPIEGFTLETGWESFVGAAEIPMRYGLTAGELALYFKDRFGLSLSLDIVRMKGYNPAKKDEWGWPKNLTWVNPSPNAPTLNMARCYSGTVLIEGANLSEGRGTTRALEQMGASDLDFSRLLQRMHQLAPSWLKGCILRECFFEPTFHKHAKKLCHGFHIHTDGPYYNHLKFKPFRIVALMLKAIRELYPKYEIYRDFEYEYTKNVLAFDVINGGPKLRHWIEDQTAKPKDLEKMLSADEKSWLKVAKKYYLY